MSFVCFTKKCEMMILLVAFYQYALKRVGRPDLRPFQAPLCGVCAFWMVPCGLSEPSTHIRLRHPLALLLL